MTDINRKMPLDEIFRHYKNALAELSAKHAEILRENNILAAKIAQLEQTLALLRAQRDLNERSYK